MAPAWLHGAIKRSDAESLVGTADGTFLVRRRPAKGGGVVEDEFVLTVVFKGKPTHHGIKRDETGAMCVNGKPHGAKTSVEDLIGFLDRKRKGWPVALDKPVAASTTTAVAEPASSVEAAPASAGVATTGASQGDGSSDPGQPPLQGGDDSSAAEPAAAGLSGALASPVLSPEPSAATADRAEGVDDQTQAAIKIQTSFRSMKARRESKQQPLATPPTADGAVIAAEVPPSEAVLLPASTTVADSPAVEPRAKETKEESEEETEEERAHIRRRLTSLGITRLFSPPSPETERKPGVPWGRDNLKRTGSKHADQTGADKWKMNANRCDSSHFALTHNLKSLLWARHFCWKDRPVIYVCTLLTVSHASFDLISPWQEVVVGACSYNDQFNSTHMRMSS